jgi:hypothetical protein
LITPSARAGLVLLVSTAIVSCVRVDLGATPSPSGQVQEVVGIVTRVEGTGPAAVTRFIVRTDAGDFMTFDIGDHPLAPSFPAAHLHEHQASAQPVRVSYVQEGSRLVVVALADAP